MAPEGQKPTKWLWLTKLSREMYSQPIVHKALSWGTIRKFAWALVQLNGDNFLFYNKSLGDLNVEKFTHKHPRRVDGVNDVWHAYPHSSRNLHDIGIARKLDWRLYKRLF